MRKYSHLRKRGKRFPVLLQKREKSPNCICLTAGSVGRGRLLLVSPYSAVPGFIRPFTNTRRQTWAKTSCVEQMGYSGTFFLAPHTGMPNQTQINFLKRGFRYSFSPGTLWGILLLSSLSYPHVWSAQAVTALTAFIQLRPLKLQSTQSVFPLHATSPTGPVTRLSHISCCRPTCFK